MTPVRAAVWVGAAAAVAGTLHALANRRHLRHLSPEPTSHVARPVSVLVPARDEADTIATIVADLLAQQGVPELEIVILDDDSADGTPQIATAAAAGDPRVRVIRGTEAPPPGWLGKPHACHRLAQQAHGQVLVFVDADVRLHPRAVAAAVADLDVTGSALISAWPRQLAATPLAEMLQPLQQWSWLTTLPLRVAANSARETMAAANGQFLVFDRAGYERIGGHAAVADQVLEDIGLARAIKRADLRADVVDAAAVATCLMYRTDRDLVAGYSKSLWAAFGGPVRSVAATAGLALLTVIPPGYAVLGSDATTRVVGAVGYLATTVGRLVTARATGDPPSAWAATHPAGVTALALLTARSVSQHHRGTLRWRGRPVTA